MSTPQLTVNEGCTLILTIIFRDENGDLVVPDTATYRIDIPEENICVLPATDFGSGLGSQTELVITPQQNQIRGTARRQEQVVTLEWTYENTSGTRRGTSDYRYTIRGLVGVLSTFFSPSVSPSPSASVSPSPSGP